MVVNNEMKTVRGTTYFPTFQDARNFASEHTLPTDRIIEYGKGWAIQLRVSGPYFNAKNHLSVQSARGEN